MNECTLPEPMDGRRTEPHVTGNGGDPACWRISSPCVIWASRILTSYPAPICDSKYPEYGSGVIGSREGEPAVVGAGRAAIIVASGSIVVALSAVGVEFPLYC